MTRRSIVGGVFVELLLSCGSAGPRADEPTSESIGSMSAGDTTQTPTSGDDGSLTSGDGEGSSDESSTTGNDCLFCNAPNEVCIDDVCVTTCQGQTPDPCGPAQVCDVISGQCRDPEAACTLAGDYEPCGGSSCGPGSVCDGLGSCVPIAPCAQVVCLPDGTCWGGFCSCERAVTCSTPSEADLNGPFSEDIVDLAFADDCTAWMVTLRSGPDYVRRLTPDGELDEWAGVTNLNMGEVAVLKSVTPPGIGVGPELADAPVPPSTMRGLGEVAITYTCCSACGCQATPPQGVARLIEDDVAEPLPIVIEAVVTQGNGPFDNAAADAGPMGLTWGIDRVLYVGNSTQNGAFDSADLDAGTQANVGSFSDRITAAAPISAAHLLVATLDGTVHRFNVNDQSITQVVNLGSGVTRLSHDAFSGIVYASLANLDVVAIDPFTGTVTPFATMPSRGRVTVSPDGRLWFTPNAHLTQGTLTSWDLPDTL